MSEAKTGGGRPLSPHLQVWRWHVTLFVSIAHRVTGMALYVAALIAAAGAVALASGSEAYETYKGLLGSPLGKLVLIGLTFSAFFHLANGVRHLVWDTGAGFEPRTASASATLVIGFAVVATLAVWGFAVMSGAA